MSEVEYRKYITRHEVQTNKNAIFVFGDNDQRSGFGGQAKAMRGEPNAVGIRVKKSPSMDPGSYYNDVEYSDNIKKIGHDLEYLGRVSYGKKIIFPEDGIGTGLALLNSTAPETFKYLTLALRQMFDIKNGSPVQYNIMHKNLMKPSTDKKTINWMDRKEAHRIKPGEGIVFSKMGYTFSGIVTKVHNKDQPNETYTVKLSDESVKGMKSRHLQTASTGIVIDILNKGEREETCKIKLLDGEIKLVKSNYIEYKTHPGPVKVGDQIGFDNPEIKFMVVSPKDIKTTILNIPSTPHPSDIIELRKKSKLTRKIIRRPIKKIIKKSPPVKKCKCKK